jgi:hypothetical protein
MGAVDVDDVEGEGDAGDPLGLGDELLGKQRRGNGVQNLDGIERDRLLAAELSRRQQLLDFLGRGARALADLLDQAIPVDEVAIDGRAGHASGGGDFAERRARRLL